MSENFFAEHNELARFSSLSEIDDATAAALSSFFRRRGESHTFSELLAPIARTTKVFFTAAISDRPWPPRGVGSQKVEVLAFATLPSRGNAYLLPALTNPENRTNVGLIAATFRKQLEGLAAQKVKRVAFLVHENSGLLAALLKQAAFTPSSDAVLTEHGRYIHYRAEPKELIAKLGLADLTLNDLLSNRIEARLLISLGSFFTIAEAALGKDDEVNRLGPELLWGLIDRIADSPPGGVGPSTAGPPLAGPVERGDPAPFRAAARARRR